MRTIFLIENYNRVLVITKDNEACEAHHPGRQQDNGVHCYNVALKTLYKTVNWMNDVSCL